MSHELRTPLNAVIGYTEMLQEEAADQGLTRFEPDLARIRGAGQHLLMLVGEVLDLARIESGRAVLAPVTFSVADIVNEVVDAVAIAARQRNNAVRASLAPGVGPMTADAVRLKQVLLNLLSNACKFTRDGDISIEVRQEEVAGSDRTTFVVRDTGIGIAPEDIPRLFVEFSQIQSPARRPEGAGLGLAISRRLCVLMGGTIDVDSEVGAGTTFTVRLPTSTPPTPSVED